MEVYLDRPKRVLVTVHTGWNEIIEGNLVVKSIIGNIRFDLGDTICDVSRHDGRRPELLTIEPEKNEMSVESQRYKNETVQVQHRVQMISQI